MVRAHLQKCWKVPLICDRTKFRNIHRAVLLKFAAYHVRGSGPDQGSAKQIGPLRDRPADKNSPGTHSSSDKPVRARVLLADKILGAGNVVAPGIRFASLRSRKVPRFSQFSATAHMRHRHRGTSLVQQ